VTASRLVLFDIDGTLVLTGGAGKRAMDQAFEEVFGVADAFAAMAMGGRTDRSLIEEGLARSGIPVTAAALDRFRTRYLSHLAEGIHEPGNGRKGTMPGVGPLLDTLDARPDVQLALLTGNYADGARIKLEYFGLWHRFTWGAFGDDHADREALARAAVAQAAARGVALVAPAHALVIGDTPLDIACARAVGASVVAVATGGHGVDELRSFGPDVALADLTDREAVLALLGANR
jgi:phosphoglycolate phosphatase